MDYFKPQSAVKPSKLIKLVDVASIFCMKKIKQGCYLSLTIGIVHRLF
jgi:hypothetical protein